MIPTLTCYYTKSGLLMRLSFTTSSMTEREPESSLHNIWSEFMSYLLVKVDSQFYCFNIRIEEQSVSNS